MELKGVQLTVLLETDLTEAGREAAERAASECDALLILWSVYFIGSPAGVLAEVTARAREAGAVLLNDLERLIDMQDRAWLQRTLMANGVPVPDTVVCSRDDNQEPALEERDDYIVVDGRRVRKPFVEKPVDRRDRDIYIYFPKAAGGGRSLASTRFSGDVEYVFRFEGNSRVRRAGSYVYQAYLQSEGFMVQAICVGGLAFGNAVMSGVVHQPSQVLSPGGGASSAPCAVRLRQEEKVIASKLGLVFGQTLFGITFARSHCAPDGTPSADLRSFVIDVWPAIPHAGLGAHGHDVARALLGSLGRRMLPRCHSTPSPTSGTPQFLVEDLPSDRSPVSAGTVTSVVSFEENFCQGQAPVGRPADCVCVLLVARHSERTPKQKVKAKVALDSDFAAGWLCGWLAGNDAEPKTASKPPATYELRSSEQLERLGSASEMVAREKACADLAGLASTLERIRRDGLGCHAKVEAEAAKLKVALKWGGELTQMGVSEAEKFGLAFREDVYPAEAIHELHATFRHDLKVYASAEPRCQQTAAAFCRGMLHLSSQLPQIITALVRTDKFDAAVSKAEKSAEEQPDHALNGAGGENGLHEAWDLSWEEVEARAGGRCVGQPLLDGYPSLGPALEALAVRLQRLLDALQGELRGELLASETPELLRVRYRDALEDYRPAGRPCVAKAQTVLDHLLYDRRHNFEALPEAAQEVLREALPLCEQLCDVAAPLSASVRRQGGGQAGLSLLHKLRWDLRVASGLNLGDGAAQEKHAAIYAPEVERAAGGNCVRTRLYFNHNSRLQALLSFLRANRGDRRTAPSPQPRLEFLSHILVRLWRVHEDDSLQVSCEYATKGDVLRRPVFCMPIETVDQWWSQELAQTPKTLFTAELASPVPEV